MKRIRNLVDISKKDIILCVIAISAFLLFIPLFTYYYFAKDLVSKDAIMNKHDTGLILLDRDNNPFFTFYQAQYKSSSSLNKLPKHIAEAVIASEDKDFYQHPGFSFPAIIRAFITNLTSRDHLYGGSTITQQLVKNALLNSDRTYLRKVQEVILAQEIERRYTKNQILEMYLNFVYFGENSFGIDNAAQTYFGKQAKDLTIAQTAFLTGLLPSPSSLSPFSGDIKEAIKHQHIVLQKMYEQKYITENEYTQAKTEKLVFRPSEQQVNDLAPHFALMVRNELIKKYGEDKLSHSGFRVRTTLDRHLQAYAENTVEKHVRELHPDNVSNGAAVVMNPKTGDVLALVGSANWYDPTNGKINMAITPRSVGSSFKPIVYAAGFEQRLITPASILMDVPTTFPVDYRPLDYDRKFRGPVTVRRALSNSLNIPAVEVMKRVGLNDALAMAKQLGVTTLSDKSQYGLSLVLGSGEVKLIDLTSVYATFANQGERAVPRSILSVSDKNGKQIYAAKNQTQPELSPDVAFLISSILSDATSRSEEFGNVLDIPYPAAVKTGTAEDFKDALTMGYTQDVAVGVWVGNNNNEAMDTVAGSLGAAPIWKDLMQYELKGDAVKPFTPPSNIVQAQTCQYNSYAPKTEYFISGTQPVVDCRWFAPRVTPPFIPPANLSNESLRKLRNTIKHEVRQEMREKMEQKDPGNT
jgi:1A family penicillin-binding protein